MAAFLLLNKSREMMNETDYSVENETGGYDPRYSLAEQTDQVTVVIYGYLSPIIVVFTIVTNILVSMVLLKRNMRSPTNCFLVAMALSDMMTGVVPVPCFLYFYTFGNYHEWVPHDWCYVFNLLTDFIPTIFHTASIWLTMALAIQRYVYVCHSLRAKSWCTIPNVVKGTVIIYCVAILSQLCRFFERKYQSMEFESKIVANTTVVGCISEFSDWTMKEIVLYFNLYWWFRVIFIHLIPCTSLVALNALLIHAMRSAQKKREQLLRQNRKSESKKIKDTNCTTMMLVAVVALFLLVEVPLGIELIIMIIQNTFDINLVNEGVLHYAALFTNFFILLSYPINFFIYCGMSRQFRETFKSMFGVGAGGLDRRHSKYLSLVTTNGKSYAETNDTLM